MLVKIASAAVVIVLLILSILTPEKDKFGNYTNGVRYWCDNEYFNTHF